MRRISTALLALSLTALTACNNADGLFSDEIAGDEAVEKDSVLGPEDVTEINGLGDDLPPDSAPSCPGPVDFDTDGNGQPLAAGTPISSQLTEIGIASVLCTANDSNNPNTCIIFNSNNPTGGDLDLGTPNETFGGPGVGMGGEAGELGANDTAENNVLIIAENLHDCEDNSLVDDPDDAAGGGIIHMSFTEVSTVNSITLLDIDNEEASGVEVLLDGGGSVWFNTDNLGDNSKQTLSIDIEGAVGLNVHLAGSGAVASVDICNVTVPPPPNENECEIDNDCADPDLQMCENNVCVDRPASFGGQIFVDFDANGIFDNGDILLGQPIVVELYEDSDQDGVQDSNTPVASTMSTLEGSYLFNDVNPYGTYLIHFQDLGPYGWSFTTQDAGGSDDYDSDVDPVTGCTPTILTSPGDEKGNLSCGYIPPS